MYGYLINPDSQAIYYVEPEQGLTYDDIAERLRTVALYTRRGPNGDILLVSFDTDIAKEGATGFKIGNVTTYGRAFLVGDDTSELKHPGTSLEELEQAIHWVEEKPEPEAAFLPIPADAWEDENEKWWDDFFAWCG